MLRKITPLILLLFATFLCQAQVSGYYKNAFGLSGQTLKDSLHSIISGHTEFPYTSPSTDVWDILKVTDRDPNNPDNVILLYSGASVDAAQEYNSGQGWTREHVWAKSSGDFGTSPGPGTDAHHLRPEDPGINSTRNNRNFDNCKVCNPVNLNGTSTGSYYDQNLWTFEPRDEVKGDVARMLFYMAVRYEGTNGEPDLELNDTLYDKLSKAPYHSVLTTLLTWHRTDTVDQFERNRNEAIYTQFQHNRNPFIDYPNLADYLWGDSIVFTWHQLPTSTSSPENRSFHLAPNPANHYTILTSSTHIASKDVRTFDSTGNEISSQITAAQISWNQLKLNWNYLPPGIYFVTLLGKMVYTFPLITNIQ